MADSVGAPCPMHGYTYGLLRIPLSTRLVDIRVLGGRGVAELGQEGLVEQEHVERDDQRDHHRRDDRGEAVVDQGTHHVAVAAEDQQGDQGEGMPKESTTWLRTSERLGLRPTAKTTRAGSIVMRRLSHSGMRR